MTWWAGSQQPGMAVLLKMVRMRAGRCRRQARNRADSAGAAEIGGRWAGYQQFQRWKSTVRTAQSIRGVEVCGGDGPGVRTEESELTREISQAQPGELEPQLLQQPTATIGANLRLILPVRFQRIPQMCVQRGSGAGTMVFVIGALVLIADLHDWKEPVPVEKSNVVIGVG